MNPASIKKDGRAFGTNEIRVYYEDLDTNYELSVSSNNRISRTGLLTIGKLSSQDPDLPSFSFRWDNKDDALDVDIGNVNVLAQLSFLMGKSGNVGHKTLRVIGNDRSYYCEIVIDGRTFFRGLIAVSLSRELELLETVKMVDHPIRWMINRFRK